MIMHLYAVLITMEVMKMNEQTIDKLIQLRMSVFAEEYRKQLQDPSFNDISFRERLSLLVDSEYDARHNHKIELLIKNAHFSDSKANLVNIDYFPDRHLNRDVIEDLTTNQYVQDGLGIILNGATGCGKTFIACALGINACRSGYKVKYIRLPELFSEFEVAKIQGTYRKMISNYQKYSLLILDEFLLTSTNEEEQTILLEIMESRSGLKSTIFCSQFSPEGWHSKLGSGPIADSILDRIIHTTYKIYIDGEQSMRQRKSLVK